MRKLCTTTLLLLSLITSQASAEEPAKPPQVSAQIRLESSEIRLRPSGNEVQRSKAKLGELIMFRADVAGEAVCKWAARKLVVDDNGNVRMESAGGLLPLDKGRTAVFSNQPGVYCIILSAGGPNGVDTSLFELEIEGAPIQVQIPPAAPTRQADRRVYTPPPLEPEPQDIMEEQPPMRQENLPSVIARLATAVPHANRAALLSEAKIVEGCFRATASAIKTGTFTQGGDAYIDTQMQAKTALGDASYRNWRSFFVGMAPELRGQTTPTEQIVLFNGIGVVLGSLR